MSNPKDIVKQVRKYTRRKFSPDEKIRIVLEGLRGDVPISDLCRGCQHMSQHDKMEIIRLVESSELSTARTLSRYGRRESILKQRRRQKKKH